MEAAELVKKIRELEEGQAELKREISRIVPERGGAVVAAPAARGPRRTPRPALRQDPALAGAGRARHLPRRQAHVLEPVRGASVRLFCS